MRGPLRTAKPISYRETSSDEEGSNPSDTPDTTPPPPSKRTRPRTSAALARLSRHAGRSMRSQGLPRVSYREDSSGDSHAEEEEDARPSGGKRQRVSLRVATRLPVERTKPTAARTKRPTHSRTFVKSRSGSARPVAPVTAPVIASDGLIPAWTELPYEILLQIFTFASYPLHSENFAPSKSIGWLLDTARVCKAFAEPALTALYRSPAFVSLDKPHRLLELLKQPPDSHVINYNVKVRRLELDLRTSLAYTAPGWGSKFDLGELIPHVPQLQEITITNVLDQPGFRRTEHQLRWKYPETLFSSLLSNKPRLKSWQWNGNLCTKEQTFGWMKAMHVSEPFVHLVHVGFSNFDPPEVRDAELPDTFLEEELAKSICALPDLSSLTFEQSDIVNEVLLPLLPINLTRFTIINCGDLTSESLHEFLLTHGSQLKELVLNHNQALDLSFLPALKTSCPHLEVFRMDLNYYNSHITHHDSDPRYENLLEEGQKPTWPATLQVLEMVHLRQWTSSAAETFFGSLIESAQELPDLRKLVLKAILNIGWRDRAGFRDQWIRRFKQVFHRKFTPPVPHLVSLRAFKTWKDGNASPEAAAAPPDPRLDAQDLCDSSNSDVPIARKRKRSATVTGPSNSLPTPIDDTNASQSWGKRRLRPRNASQNTKDASSSEDEENRVSNVEGSPSVERFVQGMCEIVDIRIDNQRPRESQFHENDFLDSEVSGDEDWNGDDAVDGGERYAW